MRELYTTSMFRRGLLRAKSAPATQGCYSAYSSRWHTHAESLRVSRRPFNNFNTAIPLSRNLFTRASAPAKPLSAGTVTSPKLRTTSLVLLRVLQTLLIANLLFEALTWRADLTTLTGSSMAPTLCPDSQGPDDRQHSEGLIYWKNVRYVDKSGWFKAKAPPQAETQYTRAASGGKDGNDAARWRRQGYEWQSRPADLQRGQIVVFATPYDPHRLSVKRVIAIEGDVVVALSPAARGQKHNKARLEADAASSDPDQSQGRFAPLEVPFGHVWLEGDNQAASRDSHDFGPVSKSLILGVVTHVYSPRGRRTWHGWGGWWGWASRRRWEDDGWEGRNGVQDRVRLRDEAEREGMVPEEWHLH